MHTEAGDLYQIAAEPRKERAPRKPPIHLIQCRVYNAEKPVSNIHSNIALKFVSSSLMVSDCRNLTQRPNFEQTIPNIF